MSNSVWHKVNIDVGDDKFYFSFRRGKKFLLKLKNGDYAIDKLAAIIEGDNLLALFSNYKSEEIEAWANLEDIK